MSLSFLTWNIWNDKMYLDERLKGICLIIQEKNPDFICLQEISNNVLQKLQRMEWTKYYFCSQKNISGRASGEVIYSKYPFVKNESFPFKNSSSASHINIVDINIPLNKIFPDADSGHSLNGCNIVLITSQLERLKLFSELRKEQFYGLVNFLVDKENVFFMGDTGFTDEEDDVLDLTDPWSDAHMDHLYNKYTTVQQSQQQSQSQQQEKKESDPNDEFAILANVTNIDDVIKQQEKNTIPDSEQLFTVDSDSNSLVNGFNQYRYDRVLYKSPHWKLGNFELLGCYPLKTTNSYNKKIYPSSHFGIYCEFVKYTF